MKAKYFIPLVLLCLLAVNHVKAQSENAVFFVNKAGTLKDEMIKEKRNPQNISKMILTGYINARDFVWMRDSMPNLTYLDMKNVSIKAYSGSDGTSPKYALTIREIPSYAFCRSVNGRLSGKTSLQQVILPSGIVNIGKYAFKNCDNLNVIQMTGNNAPFIKSEAINEMNTAIFVPMGSREHYRSHKGWGDYCIVEGDPVSVIVNVPNAGDLGGELLKLGHQPSEINYLTITGNLNDDDFKLIRDFMDNLVSIDLSKTSAISLPEYTFSQKKNLMDVKLPDKLIRIGQGAFSGCIHLGSNLYLPATLATVESSAFIDCDKLTHVIALGNRITVIGKDIFRNNIQKIEFAQ